MLIALAHLVPPAPAHWLSWGLGFFVVGWIIQFVGHYYEGKKPAFADDLVGLLVGPMFVTPRRCSRWAWHGPGGRGRAPRRPDVLRDLAHPATLERRLRCSSP